jgi:uncharacterized protein
MDQWDLLEKTIGFDWDEGNTEKNWVRHGVSPSECEQVFFNLSMIVFDDARHSQSESRYYALGQTNAGRGLFVVFTIRRSLIRVISARDMNKKERKAYQNEKENT